MRKSLRLSIVGVIALVLVMALAPVVSWAGVNAAIVSITQSNDTTTVTPLNSVACPGADDSYWRAFNLASFGITTDYTVSSVDFGVEDMQFITSIPLTVNLYSTPTGTFPAGALTLVGTGGGTVTTADAGTIVNIPVAGTVPAGEDLAVEIFAPDTSNGGNFFIGSNAAGQSAPSYIQSAFCGAAVPTNLASLGFPGMHIIMVVTGDDNVGGVAPPVTVLNVPNKGEIMITAANGQPAYDSPAGSVIRHNGGAELWLPQDYDGNGFDTYVITETVVVDGRTWYGIFLGNETWAYVPADTVTVTR